MDYMICDLCNFTLGTKVVVVKDNLPESVVNCETIDKLSKILYNIYIEKNIKKIILKGNKDFTCKIGNEVRELNNSNFNKGELEIEFI